MKDNKLNSLKQSIVKLRDAGQLYYDMQPISQKSSDVVLSHVYSRKLQIELVNEFIKKLGFKPLEPTRWVVVNKKQAEMILTNILSKDMTYKTELMSKEDAQEITNDYLNNFKEENTTYFSNGLYVNTEVRGWNPISNESWDTGIICIDDNKVAILWFVDGD